MKKTKYKKLLTTIQKYNVYIKLLKRNYEKNFYKSQKFL